MLQNNFSGFQKTDALRGLHCFAGECDLLTADGATTGNVFSDGRRSCI
jgi:hypothetical protein